MAKKKTIGASLLKQIDDAEAAAKFLTTLKPADEKIDDNNWTAVFAKAGTEPSVFTLDYLSKFPNLGQQILIGYRIGSRRQSDRTRSHNAENLNHGFCKFLSETARTEITLDELDRSLFNAFKIWLYEVDPKTKASKLGPRTIENYSYALRTALKGLRSTKEYGLAANQAVASIPKLTKPKRKRKSRERISHRHLSNIVKAAEQDIRIYTSLLNKSAHIRGADRL